jgi:hypothetical protein
MMARPALRHSLHRRPRSGLWRDVQRDWRSWSRGERIAAPIVLGCMIAATVPVLWLVSL